jgi:hypothetical protein
MLNLDHWRFEYCEKLGPEAHFFSAPANNFQWLSSFGEDLRATDNN